MSFGVWSQANELRQSVRFSAPEVLKGEDPQEASDVFSMGMLFYLMLTGRTPKCPSFIEEHRHLHKLQDSDHAQDLHRWPTYPPERPHYACEDKSLRHSQNACYRACIQQQTLCHRPTDSTAGGLQSDADTHPQEADDTCTQGTAHPRETGGFAVPDAQRTNDGMFWDDPGRVIVGAVRLPDMSFGRDNSWPDAHDLCMTMWDPIALQRPSAREVHIQITGMVPPEDYSQQSCVPPLCTVM